MSDYLEYNSEGRILRKFSGVSEEDLALNGVTNFVKGNVGNIREFYIENGSVKRKPEPPNEFYEFDYQSKSWKLNQTILEQDIKDRRKQLLLDSDWTDMVSAVDRLPKSKYKEWQTYRQALRDITSQSGYPLDVSWPVKPE